MTSPGIQLGLPDSNFIYVEGMQTSGQGTSQDGENILYKLKDALDASTDENDLMHWYVTAGVKVNNCTPNSFNCDYADRAAVVMALWLPQNASTINLNFYSDSKSLSISIWTYDYKTDTMLLHDAVNNSFNGSDRPYYYNVTHTSQSVNHAFTGHYLLVMFNTAQSEKTMLDINGLGVSYSIDGLSDDYVIEPRTNPFQPEVGTNIVGDDSVPEPATATLSLLALAGLAARRRRK
ncbi:MAG: PEP-CTERM sorting domain-containing protein [Akkermansia sp.]|nr:PEP-CTERM sorting domain-containing protein [Akkermansia sp.]